MILARPHGYPTEKVLNTDNKIGGKAYNSTANKKGCSNYSDATKRRLEDGWPKSMSCARRQTLNKFQGASCLSKLSARSAFRCNLLAPLAGATLVPLASATGSCISLVLSCSCYWLVPFC